MIGLWLVLSARAEPVPEPAWPPPWGPAPVLAPLPAPLPDPLPDRRGRWQRYTDTATLGLPFWVGGAATTGWLVARNFNPELEPLAPEVSALSWTAAAGLSYGGAGALDFGALQAARTADRPDGAGRLGLGLLGAATALLVADAGVLLLRDEQVQPGSPAETIAVGAVVLAALSGAPGAWQLARNRPP